MLTPTAGHRVATFELAIPLEFNPDPGAKQGEEIPPDWIDEVESALCEKWGGAEVQERVRLLELREGAAGTSVYPNPSGEGRRIRYREPQRLFFVDLGLDDAAEAWDWFATECPLWAKRFDQREIYLRVSTGAEICTFRFPPPPEQRPENINPFIAFDP